MSLGATYRFYIPSKLAYGSMGRPPKIGRNQDLILRQMLDHCQRLQPKSHGTGRRSNTTSPSINTTCATLHVLSG